MPTLRELINAKNDRLVSVPDKFYSRVEKSEKQIYARLTELLAKLKVDKDGNFIRTVGNLNLAQEINDELKKVVFGSEYLEAVTEFAREFNIQKDYNNKYFERAFPDFTPTDLSTEIVKLSQAQSVELLTGGSLDVNFFDPIKSQVIDAVETGASFIDTIKSVREAAMGIGEEEGKLLRYSKQIAHDSFALSDRAYSDAIATDLGAVWYLYSGEMLPTSRPFCRERHNEYFHKKEIEAWASLSWDGKFKGTNSRTIFKLAGGYNCGHSIMAVGKAMVPKDVIDRNISNGNYK